MKFRTLCFAVLLASGTVFVAGCGKGASAPADKKESAAKTNTPIEVARSFYEALKKEDTASAISLSDGELKEIIKKAAEYSAQIKKAAADGDETAKQKLAERDKAFSEMQLVFKGEKIDGDLATVDVVMIRNGKSEVDKVFFKKVNGEWKVISENDYRIANGDFPPIDVTKKWHKATFKDADSAKALEYVTDDKMKKQTKDAVGKAKTVNSASFGDAKIDGDTAKVKVITKNGDGDKTVMEYQHEKKDGQWKISKITPLEDGKNKDKGSGDEK